MSLSVRCLSLRVCPSPVSLRRLPLLFLTLLVLRLALSPITAAPSHNEEYFAVAIHNPPTGLEPNLLDDLHYSETIAAIFQNESGDIDTEPSYLCDAELHDETIGKAQSSQLYISEREPANQRQILSLS